MANLSPGQSLSLRSPRRLHKRIRFSTADDLTQLQR